MPLLRSAHSGEWTVVARGGVPLPTRPSSPRLSRAMLSRFCGAGIAVDAAMRTETIMVMKNVIFAVENGVEVVM